MKYTLFSAILTLTLVLSAQNQRHEHDRDHAGDAKGHTDDIAASLSPELRELLRKEMLLLSDGMRDLSAELVQGQWKAVAEIAANMRDSYILKQSLTPDQKKELKAKLSDAFVASDQYFHETAGKLVHAAHANDAELSVFYQARMLEACVGCHAAFAAKRFPGLAKRVTGHDH